MRENIKYIIDKYLELFPDEKEKLKMLQEFINKYSKDEITDWNNFAGHIVASGFIYAKEENKFLVLYHNEFKRLIYPGGHVDATDACFLDAAKRELFEETGIKNMKLYVVNTDDENIPLDIDIHKIGYNDRLNLPEHYHFDFRYLFLIDNVSDVKIDPEEHMEYKWISPEEFYNRHSFETATRKLKRILSKDNK